MDIELLREYCLSLPGTTEAVKWEVNLCFMIEQKIFLIVPLDTGTVALKCDPEEFEALVARDGIRQARHLARGHWIGLEHTAVLPEKELKTRVSQSRERVLKKLPKKIQLKYL